MRTGYGIGGGGSMIGGGYQQRSTSPYLSSVSSNREYLSGNNMNHTIGSTGYGVNNTSSSRLKFTSSGN